MKYGLFLYSILTVSFSMFVLYPHISCASAQDKPLMVIRFRNDPVPYEQNLRKITKMALSEKSDTLFDLVAISPETDDKHLNRQLEANTKLDVERIVRQMIESGASPELIRTSYKKNKLLKTEEVQIFVQ